MAYLAKRLGLVGIILPAKNFFQASLISGIEITLPPCQGWSVFSILLTNLSPWFLRR
jgi:hypothetical protein